MDERGAALLMLIDALRVFAPLGLKITLKVQLAPRARDVPQQLSVSVQKSSGMAPATATEVIDLGRVPMLVTVTQRIALFSYSGTVPKSSWLTGCAASRS